ncbi:transcriptional regulator [Capsulimonas corticalis]|uniref:Transcriptional regulator n=1 Tax=Capsulimonas corticalis TaxID=2219043 RepID=A0A402D562_9BACT|nr:helix-turn-helix transcriptional regulator [Capsulimonas corticalis]BDI29897.1 transcriptional regulator [Capsulimonas corticalis]
MANSNDNLLGNYLKNRRAKLDPSAFGFTSTRRRTPGLRREEVAQRANVSATWYTWLEQGRGGTPSTDVLDGIASALALTADEREHLFLLAQHRPPEVRYQEAEGVTPQLQRVLDSMEFSPAIVRTVAWDVIAWNHAAMAVLADYETIPPEQRNILRLFFRNPRVRNKTVGWEKEARAVVAAFRADAARSGVSERIEALIDEMIQSSPEFQAIWSEHDVQAYGEGAKHFHHSTAGPLTLEYSNFKVDGRPDLGLVIFTAATPADAECIRSIIRGRV